MIRQIQVPSIGANASAIGFGCASLGSRVGERAGLRALEHAFELGVTWYDVAPSYGDGEAEAIIGKFIAARRSEVRICTKVGIAPVPIPRLMKAIKPLAQAAVGILPIRGVVSRARPAAAKMPLSATLVETSLTASLRRLRTDHVDVLALHGPAPEEVIRDDVVRALEKVVQEGKARTVGIAGSSEAALAGLNAVPAYGIAQVANNPFERSLDEVKAGVRSTQAATYVTHSVFGAFGALDRLRAALTRRRDVLGQALDAGYDGRVDDVASAILADFALASNTCGVTLASMFRREHLEFLAARASEPTTRRAIDLLDSAGLF